MSLIQSSREYREKLRQFVLAWTRPQVLVAEEARRKLNTQLQSHWPDQHIDVYELIHEKFDAPNPKGEPSGAGSNFIVFIDPEMDVDWVADDARADKSPDDRLLAESIGARRCGHLPRPQVLEFKRLVGQAIVAAFEGSKSQPRKLALQAAVFLKDRTVERSRLWTLSAAHIQLLAFTGLTLWLIPMPLLETVGGFIPSGCLVSGIGGLLGAYLSLIQKAGSGKWDAASGLGIHAVEVFTKLISGLVLGGIAFAVSQSVHAPPSIKAVTGDAPSLFVFGLAAGMFERLIPKMVSEYTDDSHK